MWMYSFTVVSSFVKSKWGLGTRLKEQSVKSGQKFCLKEVPDILTDEWKKVEKNNNIGGV